MKPVLWKQSVSFLIPTTCAALAVSATVLGLHAKAAVFAPLPPFAAGWEVEIVYII